MQKYLDHNTKAHQNDTNVSIAFTYNLAFFYLWREPLYPAVTHMAVMPGNLLWAGLLHYLTVTKSDTQQTLDSSQAFIQPYSSVYYYFYWYWTFVFWVINFFFIYGPCSYSVCEQSCFWSCSFYYNKTITLYWLKIDE